MSQDRGADDRGVSPEDAEKLAERFKPVWELEEAPFTAPVAATVASPPSASPANPAPASIASASQPAPPAPASPADARAEAVATVLDNAPIVAPTAAVTAAARRRQHSATMVGIAPPPGAIAEPEPPPNAFAVAIPPTPLAPATVPKSGEPLPSVVLADSVTESPDSVAAEERTPVPPQNDSDASALSRKGSKVRAAIVIGVLLACGALVIRMLNHTEPEEPPVEPAAAVTLSTPPAPVDPVVALPPPAAEVAAPATSANAEVKASKPALMPKASDELARTRPHDVPPARPTPLTPPKPAPLIAPAVTVAKPAPAVAPAQKPAPRATQPTEPATPPKAVAPRKPALTNRPAGSIVRETPF